jgi:hypothetical protein
MTGFGRWMGVRIVSYKYEPEEGYFLVGTWVMNYAVVVGFGFLMAFLLEMFWSPPLLVEIAVVILPMPILSFDAGEA